MHLKHNRILEEIERKKIKKPSIKISIKKHKYFFNLNDLDIKHIIIIALNNKNLVIS